MKLTTRGRYAVTAMLDLALHSPDGPVSLADISSRQSVSLPYLEQLFSKLKRGGLVTSHRGPGGGYELGLSVSEISVADIIESVNEDLNATQCGGSGDCRDGSTCMTHDLWTSLSRHIESYLQRISLEQLVLQQRAHDSLQPSEISLRWVASQQVL